jgi:Cof subfamily protein (haloacid dehalogenase superfamily)
MSKIRMIVSDLDGTLLSENHILTDSVIDAIQQFRSSGGLFTFATGRFRPSVQKIVDELNIDIPFILCNGSVIADRDQILETATLSLNELAPLLMEADRQELTVMLFREEIVEVFRQTQDVKLFQQKEGLLCGLVDPGLSAWRDTDFLVQKVLIIGDMQRIKTIWNSYPASFRGCYTTVQSEENFFEIIPLNQSKGEALKKLMALMKVSPSEVMSLGNQLNDMDMLEYSGIGVAVANSHPDLKAKASFVCSKSYGEGVVEAMERFVYKEV